MDDTVNSCYKGSLKVLKQACHYYSSDPGKAPVLYFCSILVTKTKLSCVDYNDVNASILQNLWPY
jgi:hypothetical protein